MPQAIAAGNDGKVYITAVYGDFDRNSGITLGDTTLNTGYSAPNYVDRVLMFAGIKNNPPDKGK